MDSVKWTYVGVGCGVFCIAIMFCFANIPEFDEEAQMAAEGQASGELVRRASFFSPHLWLGAVTQFIYTGVQVAIASMFMFYSADVGKFPDHYGSMLLALAQMCFTIGRFIGAALFRYFRPDRILAFFAFGAILATIFAIAMTTHETTYALMVILFFESIMFPTNFALATRDLGRYYKYGAPICKFTMLDLSVSLIRVLTCLCNI